MVFPTRITWPSLLFLVSISCALTAICIAIDTSQNDTKIYDASQNDAKIYYQLNTTRPSNINGGGGGWWSWGWGWGGGSGGGGGGGGGSGGGGGGGGGDGWGCGRLMRRHRRHRNIARRERFGSREHPNYSPRLYRVGEYARCTGRNLCRGMVLNCPLHCNGPCYYDCDRNCKAHCRL